MLGKTSAQIEPSGWASKGGHSGFSQVGYLQKRWIIGGCKNLVSLTSFRRAVGSPKQLRVIATIGGLRSCAVRDHAQWHKVIPNHADASNRGSWLMRQANDYWTIQTIWSKRTSHG